MPTPQPPPAEVTPERRLGRPVVFVSGTDRDAAVAASAGIDLPGGGGAEPVELRFHAEPGGLADLVEGRASPAGFADRFRERWWRGDPVLEAALDPALVELTLSELAANYPQDPMAAARTCFAALTSALTARHEGALVDVGDRNIDNAQVLHKLLPDARFVSAVRDGRDYCHRELRAGRASRPAAALARWLEQVRSLETGISGEEDGGAYRLPADRLQVFVPTGWAEHRRADELTFSERRLNRRYANLLRRLRRNGIHCAAALSAAYEASNRPG